MMKDSIHLKTVLITIFQRPDLRSCWILSCCESLIGSFGSLLFTSACYIRDHLWQLYLPDGVDGVSVVDGGRVVTEIEKKRRQIELTLEKLIIEFIHLLIVSQLNLNIILCLLVKRNENNLNQGWKIHYPSNCAEKRSIL